MITGNYNQTFTLIADGVIIPYQMITGNYNIITVFLPEQKLYHTK